MSRPATVPRTPALWRGLPDIPADLGPTVVTIGHFDGVHRGHQELLRRARELADRHGTPAGAVTFDRHVAAVLAPGSEPPALTDLRRKAELLCAHGMDFVLALPVTPALLGTTAELFVAEVLLAGLRARGVVVGSNFRFGRGAAGDPALLAAETRPHGVDVVAAGLLIIDGDGVSSTRIRGEIGRGDVAAAARLLGHAHRIDAVNCGDTGSRVELAAGVARPAPGRYRVTVTDLGRGEPGATPAELTVGPSPTAELRVLAPSVRPAAGSHLRLELEHRLS